MKTNTEPTRASMISETHFNATFPYRIQALSAWYGEKEARRIFSLPLGELIDEELLLRPTYSEFEDAMVAARDAVRAEINDRLRPTHRVHFRGVARDIHADSAEAAMETIQEWMGEHASECWIEALGAK